MLLRTHPWKTIVPAIVLLSAAALTVMSAPKSHDMAPHVAAVAGDGSSGMQPSRTPAHPQRQPTRPVDPVRPPAVTPSADPSGNNRAESVLIPAAPSVFSSGEHRHRIEVSGVNLPPDTRIVTPLRGHHEAQVIFDPNSTRASVVASGRIRFDTITLSGRLPLEVEGPYLWWRQVVRGIDERRDISVILISADGNEVQRYNIFGALPVQFALDVGTASWSITLAFELLEMG